MPSRFLAAVSNFPWSWLTSLKVLSHWTSDGYLDLKRFLQRLRRLSARAGKLQKWRKLGLARKCHLAVSGARPAGAVLAAAPCLWGRGLKRGCLPASWELPVAGIGSVPAGHKSGEIFRSYMEVLLKDLQIGMKFIQCTKGELGSYFFCHLFNSGELFTTSCSCISNSKQREIIFNADRKGGTCVGKLTCSPVSYSTNFPIIKQGWHIRQILDRLAALFISLRCTVIHLWSLPCGNCLFIENWIYFEMLMIGYII